MAQKIQEYTDNGLLVPDELVYDELMKMVKVKCDVDLLIYHRN